MAKPPTTDHATAPATSSEGATADSVQVLLVSTAGSWCWLSMTGGRTKMNEQPECNSATARRRALRHMYVTGASEGGLVTLHLGDLGRARVGGLGGADSAVRPHGRDHRGNAPLRPEPPLPLHPHCRRQDDDRQPRVASTVPGHWEALTLKGGAPVTSPCVPGGPRDLILRGEETVSPEIEGVAPKKACQFDSRPRH